MSWRIIVASSDAGQREALKEGAAAIREKLKESGNAAEIQEAATVAGLKGFLRGTNEDLVIATASLPGNQSAPVSQDQPGLDLIKRIQAQAPPPPCILVSERSEHRGLAKSMPRCRWLQVSGGTDYIEDCLLLAKDMDVWAVAGAGNGKPVRGDRDDFALIEVDVPNETKHATVKYVINVGGTFEEVPTSPLDLNQKKVDALVAESRKLSENFSKALKSEKTYERWQAHYHSLGERFHQLLDRDVFANHLRTIGGVVKGRDLDIRLRFSLGRFVFDGLWESICDPEGKHLMLQATISRRERDAIGSFARSRSGAIGALNILVVGATLDDNSEVKGPGDLLWKKYWGNRRLDSLPHIIDEIAAIKGLEDTYDNVKVHLLSGEDRHDTADAEWSLAEKVRAHLADYPTRYDVVHFAGHALFATSKAKKLPAGKGKKPGIQPLDDERGYLVFSGKGVAHAISIATVANWLKNTSVELVYLSCCRSSASRAAAEFARNSIRTTIGFSWDLVDERAVEFTRRFYRELLKNRLNVCSALRRAREDLHREYENGDPIWASPVLFAQPSDWTHVEGVLRPPVRP